MNFFAIIDPRMPDTAVKKLEHLGIKPLKMPLTPLVEEPVSGHPDIQVFLHNGKAFVHPDIDKDFRNTLEMYCEVIVSGSRLSRTYPSDVAYNIAVAGRIAFHRSDATDPLIREYLQSSGVDIINVNQGYSKCSTLIVDDSSIITADASIDRAARNSGLASLLISPGYISLPGYRYGFIGGATGRFSNKILFTGSIGDHPERESICSFIESRDLEIFLLSDEPAIDTGSILVAEY